MKAVALLKTGALIALVAYANQSLALVNTDADTVAWSASDTGRMRPAYQDLSGYDTPAMCVVAVKGAEALVWRQGESDTLPKNTPYDTMPTFALDVGRMCMEQFDPLGVSTDDLKDMIQLAILIGDTSRARIGIKRYLSLYEQEKDKNNFFLQEIVGNAVVRRPTAVEFARSLLQYADIPQTNIDANPIFNRIVTAYTWGFDTSGRRDIIDDQIEYIKRRNPNNPRPVLSFIYRDSLDFSLDVAGEEYADELARVGDLYLRWTYDEESDSLERLMAEGSIYGRVDFASVYGRRAPQLRIFKKFPEGETEQPIPGRVTLVLPAFALGPGRIEPYLARLRRWHEKYHSQGLDIVLVTATKGFAWESPPLDPDEEAKVIAWYYQDYLNLPFKILVEKTEVVRINDGRLIRYHPDFFSHLHGRMRGYLNYGHGYLVGRNGLVSSYFGSSNSFNFAEPLFEEKIIKELAKEAATE